MNKTYIWDITYSVEDIFEMCSQRYSGVGSSTFFLLCYPRQIIAMNNGTLVSERRQINNTQ